MGNFTDTATIRGTYIRSRAEGLGVSESFLRESCRNGTLKHCRAGRQYLIYWPNLIKLLEDGAPKQEVQPSTNGIRRVPENMR